MTQQTEAQRLADWLDAHANGPMAVQHEAAALLRRQDKLLEQAELACQLIVNAFDALAPVSTTRQEPLQINAARDVVAAIRAHRESK